MKLLSCIYWYTQHIFLYVYIYTHTLYRGFRCQSFRTCQVYRMFFSLNCFSKNTVTSFESLGQEACGRSLSGRSLAQCHHQQGGLGTKETSSIIAWYVWEVVFACAISCASLIMSLSLWTPARFRCLGGDQDYRVFLELWDQLCVGSVSCHT